MRHLILILASILASSEQVELTLKDGRKLSSEYTAETGVLSLKLGSVTIKSEDISDIRKINYTTKQTSFSGRIIGLYWFFFKKL